MPNGGHQRKAGNKIMGKEKTFLSTPLNPTPGEVYEKSHVQKKGPEVGKKKRFGIGE